MGSKRERSPTIRNGDRGGALLDYIYLFVLLAYLVLFLIATAGCTVMTAELEPLHADEPS